MFASTTTLVLLALLLIGFSVGRWRYDLVAMVGLGFAVVLGLVPGEAAFSGFSHPAVVTVAAVLVLSRGLALSPAICCRGAPAASRWRACAGSARPCPAS